MNGSNIDENKYTSKKKLYEKLGALKFKKVVLKVEKLKFKLISKISPKIYDKYSTWCNKRVNKLCKKNISEDRKKEIIFEYNCRKMAFRRELIERKNINYHFNDTNASTFYKYLLWNKKVHVKGMIGDILTIFLSIMSIILFSNILFIPSCIFGIYGIISLVINFQCVNLQNYNICRFEEKKHILEKIEAKRKEKDFQKYYDVSKAIYDELTTSIELPKGEDIVSKLTTKEQLEQLRNLVLEIKNSRMNEISSNEELQKNKGGRV